MSSDTPQGSSDQFSIGKGRIRDLSQSVVRKKNMDAASFSLVWNSYTLNSKALAIPAVQEAARRASVGTLRPVAFEVGEIEGNVDDVPLVPLSEATDNSIAATWVKGGTGVRLEMAKFFAVRPFPIPRGSRATIPVSAKFVDGLGWCLILHFGQAEFEPIEEGKKRGAAAQKAQSKPAPSARPADAAAAAAEPEGEGPKPER